MLKIEVWRNRQSYNYKADPQKPDGFDNNWKNNSIDLLVLLKDGKAVFHANAQTVHALHLADVREAGKRKSTSQEK